MMKNNLITLTKTMFKNDETLNNLTSKGSKSSFLKSKWMMILFVLGIAVLMGLSFGFMLADLYDALAAAELSHLIPRLLVPAAGIMVFMFGIFYVMNVFYFSKDVENYLYLPVQAGEILGAKFLVSLIYEYFIILVFFLPLLTVYGIKDGSGILYYVYMLVSLILIPVFPLVVASIISMLIMRYSSKFKNRDRFNMIAGILSLVVALGFNFGLQFFTQRFTGDPNLAIGDISELPVFQITSWVFPTSHFATEGILAYNSISGLFSILILLLITVLSFFLFYVLGNLLYFKGVIGISESKATRKALSKEEMEKGSRRKPILFSYALKELKLILRTPVYFLNCVLISLIYPLFILFPFLMGSGEDKAELESVFTMLQGFDRGSLLLGIVGVGFLMGSINIIASSAISREGKNLYFLKYIPVPYMTQIYAKIVSAFYVEAAALVIFYGIVFYLFRIDLVFFVLSLVIIFLASLVINQIGIFLDITWPKLNWDTEQKAVKQNFNSVIHMFLGFGLVALMIFLAMKVQVSLYVAFMASLLGLLILALVLHFLLTRHVEKRFKALS